MKRIITFMIASLMLLGAAPAFASAGQLTPRIPMNLSGNAANVYYVAARGSSGTPINMFNPTDVAAQRFSINEDDELRTVSLWVASHGDSIGNLTLTLYKWDESYEKSLKNKAIVTKTFENFPDNSKITMDVPSGHTGVFLLIVSNPTQRVAVYSSTASNVVSKDDCLFNYGQQQSGMCLNVETTTESNRSLETEIKASDAYSPIDLSKPVASQKMSFGTRDGKSYAVNEKGETKGYLAFKVDFGKEAPKGAKLNIRNGVCDVSKVQIIADDIQKGPILCEFYAEMEGLFDVDGELTSKMHKEITGEHTIYVVIKVNKDPVLTDMFLYDLTFLQEKPEPSWDEKRFEEFNATKDFELIDTYSDTWAGNDLLGRKLVDSSTVREYDPNRQVGLFYWTWHIEKYRRNLRASINQRVIDSYPGPESDIKNDFTYRGWSDCSGTGIWNESIYGIYSGFDEWVVRKHLEQFSAAGVDVLFYDTTNNTNVWTGAYMKMAETMHKMHLEGTQTPDMAFMLPFFDKNWNVTDLEKLYESMYSIGLYNDTWYYWEGKPVIMGYPDNLVKNAENDEVKAQHEEILDFFTFRPGQADYRKGPTQDDQWPWLEVYPQKPYGTSDKYGCEAVAVGVAQNSTEKSIAPMNGDGILGRSYTYKDRFSKLSTTSDFYGYNFVEQWDRAMELDPEFVFVTGWNEWSATKTSKWYGVVNAFPDQYSDEYSRDIEPTKGEFKDTYYYLLVNKIREFKGVRPTPTASAEKTINLSSDFAQWDNVGPDFIGIKGGTEPRNAHSLQDLSVVTNTTGRNDIVLSKVARDAENLYFYVQTAENLTPHTDENWMRLFINTDRKYKSGWEGYDFIVNRVSPTQNKATLEKWNGKYVTDWKFERVAEVDYTYSGNEMMIKIPKVLVGVGDKIDIEFKWNDNMQQQGDIMDFYVNGDTAPIGRFAYRYADEASVKNKAVDEPVDPALTLPHLTSRFVVMAIGNSKAFAYGKETVIDTASDVTAPVIVNGKTLVPVRFLAESLGWKVTWTEETQEIRIEDGIKRVILNMGSDVMRIEKEKRTLQTPAMEIENRTYVPLRDIVEALGINCYWEEPGLILCGAEEGYIELLVNGGIQRIFEEFNFN